MKESSSVIVKDLNLSIGPLKVLDNVSLEVQSGRLLTILGSSGCGKSTTLRCIAGLERPESGEIVIGDRVVFSSKKGIFIRPNERNIGYVPQSFALWPHMNVFDHVSYGLVERKWDKKRIADRVHEIMSLVQLEGLEKRRPYELSGGQQQRVALARALAYPSELLLLDEPLSSLDEKLRERMRYEIRQLQRLLEITTINVTHDRNEAFAMSDKVIVMSSGNVISEGTPSSLYAKPGNSFVASFLGLFHLLDGTVYREDDHCEVRSKEGTVIHCFANGFEHGAEVSLYINPSDIKFETTEGVLHNTLRAEVTETHSLGDHNEIMLKLMDKTFNLKFYGNALPDSGTVILQIPEEKCVLIRQS